MSCAAQLLARPLHQDDRVALGQAARPQDVRQALGQLAGGSAATSAALTQMNGVRSEKRSFQSERSAK